GFGGAGTDAGVGRGGEGVVGGAGEGRALARPRHRAGARRSQEARRSREFNVTGRVFRGLPGRDEHWLVHFIELVLDVPRKLDVPGSSTFPRGCAGGCLGGTSTGSSISSSWCSTFPGNATRKLDAPRWYRSVKQSEGHAAPDRALGLLLFPLGCADVLGQGAAGILVLLLHLPLHLCLAVHRRRGQH